MCDDMKKILDDQMRDPSRRLRPLDVWDRPRRWPRGRPYDGAVRSISYILVREDDPKPYCLNERDLRPSKKPPVDLGTVARQPAGN